MDRRYLCVVIALGISIACSACGEVARDKEAVSLVLAGQALIKVDPRKTWPNPFGSIRPIVEAADVGFTNFEMAVKAPGSQCGVPEEYVTLLGEPRITTPGWAGNANNPHAVQPELMEFLSSMGFNLMSLANNHIWDLGECGVEATRAAAARYGVTVAGVGSRPEEAVAPGYLTVGDTTIGLVASTTSHDERHLLRNTVNGVWTGHQDDWDRNIAAVREAARRADFVIYYQHYQIDLDEFAGLGDGQATPDGHIKVDDVGKWQETFAKAVIDAGASVYVGHGHRGFDGVEVYKGRPIFRQLGGLAYQGVSQKIGNYDADFAWWGLLGKLIIRGGAVESIEMIPIRLDEGRDYAATSSPLDFLAKRGLSELATGTQASDILGRFQRLSAQYGSPVRIEGDRAFIVLPK